MTNIPATHPTLSIVATMYRSEAFVTEFCERITRVASRITADFEIILVNDGSPDNSLAVALSCRASDPRVIVVDLSRNFGHHAAMITGLHKARGDHVYLTDIDLEEEPELLEQYWQTLVNNTDVDVVAGLQMRRVGSAFGNLLGKFAWGIISAVSQVDIPRDMLTTRLMTRRFVDAVKRYPERQIFIAALLADAGFRQIFIPVQKKPQHASTYSLSRRVRLFVVGLTSVSAAPLYLAVYLTLAMTVLIVAVAAYALWSVIIGSNVPGWTSIIFLVAVSTSLILAVQGVMGIYLAHIFHEVKGRPVAIIRTTYEQDP